MKTSNPLASSMKTFLCAIVMLLSLTRADAQDTLIGTFTVNYRFNAAGQFTDQSNPDYSRANPYSGNSIPPGPIFISAAPGTYKLVVESGGGCGVWSGNSSSGTFFVTGHSAGEAVTFTHSFGQIVLYYWDWVASDNDPSVQTTISVYQVQSGPRIAFSPLPFEFGRVALDGAEKTLSISNQGDQDLIGSASILSGVSTFTIVSGGGNFVVTPGQTHDVVISFTPPSSASATTFTETITVTSNDLVNGLRTVPISAELYYDKQSPLNGRFGQFYYHDQDGIDEIEIDPRWVKQNIVPIVIPFPYVQTVWCHAEAAASFQVAFILIEGNNLGPLIQTFDGLFYPRYQRGARHEPRYLSNYSWGSAIDLNAQTNPQGKRPSDDARVLWDEAFSQVGSKKTGLPGFKWGGIEFKRKDGMHYEVIP